jgi:hypothetical protein
MGLQTISYINKFLGAYGYRIKRKTLMGNEQGKVEEHKAGDRLS